MTVHRSKICKGCWQQMHVPVPLRGVASVPFRMFGIRPSRMNPNTCTVCEMMFTKVMRATKISTVTSTLIFVARITFVNIISNTCTVCEMMFTKVMRATKISVDVTVLFADLRGYTALSQSLSADQMAALLGVFYDECAAAIWEFDGLLNKTIGDAIMAIFNFPIRHQHHAARAVEAAREIQRRCHAQRRLLAASLGCD